MTIAMGRFQHLPHVVNKDTGFSTCTNCKQVWPCKTEFDRQQEINQQILLRLRARVRDLCGL